ncbi:MAG TPA: hypothetical protein VGJ44_04790 [Kribbellaceae bacterium]
MTTRVELAVYERRFRRSGLPLFIEDYSATHDVFTRAAPLFLLVFLLEMLGAISLDWSASWRCRWRSWSARSRCCWSSRWCCS